MIGGLAKYFYLPFFTDKNLQFDSFLSLHTAQNNFFISFDMTKEICGQP